jgi:hypothetical protein
VVGPGPLPEATGNGADPAVPPGPEPSADQGTDVELSFDQLRALGLGPLESARVLARGDLRARFESENDLDDLPGFSEELISTLKQLARS